MLLSTHGILASSVSTFENLKSLGLDGIDDYVDCGDNDNLSFGNGVTDSPFSISLWLNIGSGKTRGVVSKYGSSGAEWLVYIVGSKVRFLLYDRNNLRSIYATGSTTLSWNNWYNAVITYNGIGAISGVKIYINGIAETLTTAGSNNYVSMSNTNQAVQIGSYSGRELLGKIDEVAIYNTELGLGSASSIYGTGVPTSLASYSSLVSWWRCGDGDTAPILIDNGPGGNNGTMQNFSTFSNDVP